MPTQQMRAFGEGEGVGDSDSKLFPILLSLSFLVVGDICFVL